MINLIAALFVGYLLGIVTVAFCRAAKQGDELDPGHTGLFALTDDEADGLR